MQAESYETDAFVSEHADAIRQRLFAVLGGEWGEKARVSRETGITRGHLSQLLSGKRTLKLRHVRVLATARNASLRWLLTGEGHPDDVDAKATPVVSNRNVDPGALSIDQVGKLLAAAERERLTPDERALLVKYQSLPPVQRARLWALLEAGAADSPEAQPELLSDGERGRGKG